jgi:hypothetical protein
MLGYYTNFLNPLQEMETVTKTPKQDDNAPLNSLTIEEKHGLLLPATTIADHLAIPN